MNSQKMTEFDYFYEVPKYIICGRLKVKLRADFSFKAKHFANLVLKRILNDVFLRFCIQSNAFCPI